MLRDFLEIFGIFLVFAVVIGGIIVGLVVGVTVLTGPPMCESKWQRFKTEWSFWGGCQVEIDGKMVPSGYATPVYIDRIPN